MAIKVSQLSNLYTQSDDLTGESPLTGVPEYICEVTDAHGISRIGLVSLVNYQNYPDKVVPHENYDPKIVELYTHQSMDSGELINPIVLFYRGDNNLSSFIDEVRYNNPQWIDRVKNIGYKVWAVPTGLQPILFDQLNRLSSLYVADGHHRIQALKALSNQLEDDSKGFHMSFLLHESQIDIQNNDRYYVIQPDGLSTIFDKLSSILTFRLGTTTYEVKANPQITCLMNGQWCYGFIKNRSICLLTLATYFEEILEDLKQRGKVTKEETVLQKDIPSKEKHYTDNNFNFMVMYPKITANEIEECKDKALVYPKNVTCISPKLPNRLFISNLKDNQIRVCP